MTTMKNLQKHMPHLRPYLTFLSRNKMYTAINVLGFSVSLMFSILIGLYVYSEYTTDRTHTKADRTYAFAFEVKDEDGLNFYSGCHHTVEGMLHNRFPEVESFCAIISRNLRYELLGQTYLKGATIMADSTFFSMFDFSLLQGDAGQVLEARDAAVISKEFALKVFGETAPMGQALTYVVRGKQVRLKVTGIMDEMRGSCIKPADVIVPFWHAGNFNLADVDEGCSNTFGAQLFVLTKEGAHLEKKTTLIDNCLKGKYPIYDFSQEEGGYVHCHLIPLREVYMSENYEASEAVRHGNTRQVRILLMAWLMVMAFAIINYVNLTVAQSQRRAREMAIRRLVGAQRGLIMHQLISESVLMAFASMTLALLMAWGSAPYMSSLLQADIRLHDVFQGMPLIALAAFTMLVGTLSGIIPAIVLSRAKPIEVVRGTFRHRSRTLFGRAFIVLQNTITIVMVSMALVMLFQVRHMVNAPLGYDTRDLMSVDLNMGNNADDSLFCQKLQSLPCVEAISRAKGLPLYDSNGPAFPVGGKTIQLRLLVGDTAYARILGLETLTDKQVASGSRMYYNERLQHQVNAMSQEEQAEFDNTVKYMMPMMGADKDVAYCGTMRNFHISDITQPDERVIVVIMNHMHSAWQVLVKTRGDRQEAYRQVNEAYRSVYHQDMDEEKIYLEERIRRNFASLERLSHIVLLFSLVSMLVAFMGLMAMSTYFIQERQKGLAIRKVFGSESRQVYFLLAREFLSYVPIAFALAVPVIWVLAGHWISDFSYRITFAPLLVLAAGVLCLLVSLAAVSLQSYRAANENPVRHLADE